MSRLRDTMNSEHYHWGDGCEGWRLVDQPEMSVIEERMPPGTSEEAHYHERAQQYFHILAGEAEFELEGSVTMVSAGQGIRIPPGERHRVSNRGAEDLRFILTSVPSTRGDRIEVTP